eukprot:gene2080-18262_t
MKEKEAAKLGTMEDQGCVSQDSSMSELKTAPQAKNQAANHVMNSNIHLLVNEYDLRPQKRVEYGKARKLIEDCIQGHNDGGAGSWVKIEGSLFHDTALDSADADMVVRHTKKRVTRKARKAIAYMIKDELVKARYTKVVVIIKKKTTQVSFKSTAEEPPYKTDELSVDLLFDNATFGKPVNEHEDESAFEGKCKDLCNKLPALTAVKALKVLKLKCSGFRSLDGFKLEALVLMQLPLDGAEVSAYELFVKVLDEFHLVDEHKTDVNISERVRYLSKRVQGQYPNVPFWSLMDQGQYMACAERATRLRNWMRRHHAQEMTVSEMETGFSLSSRPERQKKLRTIQDSQAGVGATELVSPCSSVRSSSRHHAVPCHSATTTTPASLLGNRALPYQGSQAGVGSTELVSSCSSACSSCSHPDVPCYSATPSTPASLLVNSSCASPPDEGIVQPAPSLGTSFSQTSLSAMQAEDVGVLEVCTSAGQMQVRLMTAIAQAEDEDVPEVCTSEGQMHVQLMREEADERVAGGNGDEVGNGPHFQQDPKTLARHVQSQLPDPEDPLQHGVAQPAPSLGTSCSQSSFFTAHSEDGDWPEVSTSEGQMQVQLMTATAQAENGDVAEVCTSEGQMQVQLMSGGVDERAVGRSGDEVWDGPHLQEDATNLAEAVHSQLPYQQAAQHVQHQLPDHETEHLQSQRPHQHVQAHQQAHQHVQAHQQAHQHVQAHQQAHQHVQAHQQAHQHVQAHLQAHQHVQAHQQAHQHVQAHQQAHQHVQPKQQAQHVQAQRPHQQAGHMPNQLLQQDAEHVRARLPDQEAESMQHQLPHQQSERMPNQLPHQQAQHVHARLPDQEAESIQHQLPHQQAERMQHQLPHQQAESIQNQLPHQDAQHVQTWLPSSAQSETYLTAAQLAEFIRNIRADSAGSSVDVEMPQRLSQAEQQQQQQPDAHVHDTVSPPPPSSTQSETYPLSDQNAELVRNELANSAGSSVDFVTPQHLSQAEQQQQRQQQPDAHVHDTQSPPPPSSTQSETSLTSAQHTDLVTSQLANSAGSSVDVSETYLTSAQHTKLVASQLANSPGSSVDDEMLQHLSQAEQQQQQQHFLSMSDRIQIYVAEESAKLQGLPR